MDGDAPGVTLLGLVIAAGGWPEQRGHLVLGYDNLLVGCGNRRLRVRWSRRPRGALGFCEQGAHAAADPPQSHLTDLVSSDAECRPHAVAAWIESQSHLTDLVSSVVTTNFRGRR